MGSLEAHANGFRFNIRQGIEKIDILYSQVAHAIYEPCESGSLIVLIHLHLKAPMMVGKRKVQDVQFFTEVAAQAEDLTMRRTSSVYDPDEILEEQREREMKARLNNIFLEFTKKVQDMQSCPLEFDVPFHEFSFPGVPFRGVVTLTPCARALVGLQEWPPFCLSLNDVDVVVFERVLGKTTLREFDMVFVRKNYDEQPVRLTTIPLQNLDKIKRWLMELGVVWYSCSLNMAWQVVMKDVNKDLKGFAENGGWEAFFPSGDAEDNDDSDSDKAGSDFSIDEDDGDDDDDSDEDGGDDDDDGSDFSADEDEDDDDDDEEDEEGMDWEEMERQAEREDRKKDAQRAAKGAPPPAAKRQRRR